MTHRAEERREEDGAEEEDPDRHGRQPRAAPLVNARRGLHLQCMAKRGGEI